MSGFKVVIPARYASVRLPGKPLLDIAGKPMVVRVAERAAASGAEHVCVATDHAEIAAAVRAHGYDAVMTRDDHVSGTDRIAEVVRLQSWGEGAVVVNVQGDEPLIAPELIRQVAANLIAHPDAAMATACHAIHDATTLRNPNAVKVVMDRHGYAMYFSRAPIPYPRDAFAGDDEDFALSAYRHIGIYAYRAGFLGTYAALEPAAVELCESLEQLRVLWHGHRISVAVAPGMPAAGVDTPEDLNEVRRIFSNPS